MKEKVFKILAIVAIVILFIAVVVTSVLVSNKKKEINDIPEIDTVLMIERNK